MVAHESARDGALDGGEGLMPWQGGSGSSFRQIRLDDQGRGVVAEILSDGTVRPAGTLGSAEGDHPSGEWVEGKIGGDDWILWWQRRRL